MRWAALLLVAAGAAAQPVLPRAEAATLPGLAPPAPVGPDTTHALPDDWIARDKALHVGASFLLTLSAQYVLTDKTGWSNADALPVTAGAALGLGLLKEVMDSQRPRHPHFCWRDLAADAVGVGLAAAVVAL